MGTVYLGEQVGIGGFHRLVAIKRAHAHLLDDEKTVNMLIDEAVTSSVVRHPNVVGVVDVVEDDGELLLVLDYVEGGSLAHLVLDNPKLPVAVAVRILLDAAEGLDAVHSARSDAGEPLGLVHRDVSPQNILVGVDGISRIADFGIAKATREADTASGLVRGKPSYLAPECITGASPTPAMDVFSLGIVAWEILTGRRLFKGTNDLETIDLVRTLVFPPPSTVDPQIPEAIDDVILRALSRDPAERFESAAEFLRALRLATRISERNVGDGEDVVASHHAVGELVTQVLGERLAARHDLLRRHGTPSTTWFPARANVDERATPTGPDPQCSSYDITRRSRPPDLPLRVVDPLEEPPRLATLGPGWRVWREAPSFGLVSTRSVLVAGSAVALLIAGTLHTGLALGPEPPAAPTTDAAPASTPMFAPAKPVDPSAEPNARRIATQGGEPSPSCVAPSSAASHAAPPSPEPSCAPWAGPAVTPSTVAGP